MKTVLDLPIEIAVKTAKSAKSTVPVVVLPEPPKESGLPLNIIARYAELKDQMDSLKAETESLERFVKAAGFEFVARANIDNAQSGKEPISSVKFQDPLLDGVKASGVQDALMISVVNDYLKFDKEVVEATFATLKVGTKKPDPNNYLKWEIEADFDSDVFFTDGEFDVAKHQIFATAIAEAAAKAGVDNPLSLGKVVKVQESFHARRWKDFDLETNVRLAAVLPCKITPKLVRPKAG